MLTFACEMTEKVFSRNRPGTRRPDPLWNAIQAEAQLAADQEIVLKPVLEQQVLRQPDLENAMASRLAALLTEAGQDVGQLQNVFTQMLTSRDMSAGIEKDLLAIRRQDPAVTSYMNPFLNFKGFLALQASRIGGSLWRSRRQSLALYLQGRIAAVLGVDIHPAATIGEGVFIDHATGVVIGETAQVGHNTVILHDVTLGGTGKHRGDRHPKVGNGVFIGAGAKILGNIRIGDSAAIGAGSIVLREVPDGVTVAGVPARIVNSPDNGMSADRHSLTSHAAGAKRIGK